MRRSVVLGMVAAAWLVTSCGTLPQEVSGVADGPQPATVRLGRVVRSDISGALSFSGELRSRGQTLVTPRVSGTLARITVAPGARVSQGDVVAELDKSLLEERVLRAQSALSQAEARRAELQTSARPEEIAAAQALYNAATVRLNDVQAATQSPAQALNNLSAARQHLTDLESIDADQLALAQQSLDNAAAQLDATLRSDDVDRDDVEDSRAAVNAAREQLLAARQPADPVALQQARDAVASAERDLILADLAASPVNALEAQAFAEMAYQRLVTVSTPATETQLVAAQAESDHAAAALELARQGLNGANLVAPMSGVVTERFVAEGTPVGPGIAILEIAPLEVDLEFAVPEDQVGGVPAGQEISITVSAYPQDTFSGVVTVTAPAVDPRNRSVRARATVTDPQTKLKAGMFAQVAVATSARQDALLLPVDAVVTQADSTYTWLVVDGRAKRQTIKLGVRDDKRVEVTEGLFDGAEVILNAPATITDGQAIDVQ